MLPRVGQGPSCLFCPRPAWSQHEEILDAVWPGVTVGDESLSQAVAELRRALGPDGVRLIRTVPQRGYILDVEVAADPPSGT